MPARISNGVASVVVENLSPLKLNHKIKRNSMTYYFTITNWFLYGWSEKMKNLTNGVIASNKLTVKQIDSLYDLWEI